MKRSLTSEKVIEILKKHNQQITYEEAEKVLTLVREMIPNAIEMAKKQIAEEDSVNNGSNLVGDKEK